MTDHAFLDLQLFLTLILIYHNAAKDTTRRTKKQELFSVVIPIIFHLKFMLKQSPLDFKPFGNSKKKPTDEKTKNTEKANGEEAEKQLKSNDLT